MVEPETGVNGFWIAAYYGHGHIMKLLAEKGIDILNKNIVTKSNALHLASQKNYVNVVKMLISSKFPLEEVRSD